MRPTDFVADRIDLLAIDSDGAAVVIELKRASHKLHLLQAISYAGMVSKWSADNFIEELARSQTRDAAITELEDFLEQGELETINRSQRVILLAEDFDYEVLTTAEWLYEGYDVDIRCYRLAVAINDAHEFLTCARIYPPPELTAQAKGRGRTGAPRAPLLDWTSGLARIKNPAVLAFFKAEAEAGRERAPRRVVLRFRASDKVRFRIAAKQTFAYVSQRGRFQDDEGFWAARLSNKDEIRPVAGGKRLRFRLQTDEDFKNFKKAWDESLQNVTFLTPAVDGEGPNIDDEDTEEA